MYLAKDFLPIWFVWVIGVELLLLSVFKVPKFFGYINPIIIYFIFKTVGLQIIPETMIPTLAVLILAQKIIDKHNGVNQAYFSFLWFGIFSLFAVNLYYLTYSLIVFILFFLRQNRTGGSGVLSSLIRYKRQLFITFIIATALFIFFPRFNSFLPSANNNLRGKIGYSTEIDNSTTVDLNLSSNTAFYAELSTQLPTENLYWRGRVHSKTDGYNWRTTSVPSARFNNKIFDDAEVITAQMKYEQDFNGDVILLDQPIKVLDSNLRTYKVYSTNEIKLYLPNKKVIVSAQSTLRRPQNNDKSLSKTERAHYLQLPTFTPNILKNFIADIEGINSPAEIIQKVSDYIIKEEFSYTLSPGLMPTMGSFLSTKKGYCTHFASFLGVVLRLKNIPARLVSGFQGGFFNTVGNYYEIKSNDAHAWVEYFDQGNWKRVDPTAFVSPDRIQFGGERFLTLNSNEIISQQGQVNSLFYQAKQYLDNLDYKVSLFFDNYNKDSQKDLSKMVKLSLKEFTYIGFFLLIIIISLFYFLGQKKTKPKMHPMDQYLKRLDTILRNKKDKTAKQKTIEQMKKVVEESNIVQSKKITALEIIDEYEKLRFSHYVDERVIKNLFKEIKSKT